MARRIAQNFSLLLLGTLFGLFVVECLSKLLYTKPWYEQLIEEQTQDDWAASLHRNSYGLRDRDYAIPKPAHTKRMLLLGDSFTFGTGVADDNAIFPALIEKQLNAEFVLQGTTIEILNGGIPGSLTSDWVKLLENMQYSFQPDVIVIVFFLRDGTRTTAEESFFQPILQQIVLHNQESWLYQNFYIYRFYQDAKDRQLISTSYARALNVSYFGNKRQTEEWRIAQSNILKIKTIGEETNAQVALVIFPILAELNDGYPFSPICDLVVKFGLQNELPTYNLLPVFIGQNAADLWVSPFDQHPNEKAHTLTTNALLPFFRKLIMGQ